MDLLIVPFYNILFVYTWNDFSWLIMCDYTVWIVFYDLFALSENYEIKMINQSYNDQTGRAWSIDWGLTNNFATTVTKLLCHVEWPISFTWHKFSKCMDSTVDWVFLHDNVIEWKHFPCYCPFVRKMHRSPMHYPHKCRWWGALMFSLICLNTRLGKQSGCRWFETLSCSLWRHCDVVDLCSMDQVDPVWWSRNMGPSLGKTVLLLVLQLPMYLTISHAFCGRNKLWVKLLYEI